MFTPSVSLRSGCLGWSYPIKYPLPFFPDVPAVLTAKCKYWTLCWQYCGICLNITTLSPTKQGDDGKRELSFTPGWQSFHISSEVFAPTHLGKDMKCRGLYSTVLLLYPLLLVSTLSFDILFYGNKSNNLKQKWENGKLYYQVKFLVQYFQCVHKIKMFYFYNNIILYS